LPILPLKRENNSSAGELLKDQKSIEILLTNTKKRKLTGNHSTQRSKTKDHAVLAGLSLLLKPLNLDTLFHQDRKSKSLPNNLLTVLKEDQMDAMVDGWMMLLITF